MQQCSNSTVKSNDAARNCKSSLNLKCAAQDNLSSNAEHQTFENRYDQAYNCGILHESSVVEHGGFDTSKHDLNEV